LAYERYVDENIFHISVHRSIFTNDILDSDFYTSRYLNFLNLKMNFIGDVF